MMWSGFATLRSLLKLRAELRHGVTYEARRFSWCDATLVVRLREPLGCELLDNLGCLLAMKRQRLPELPIGADTFKFI